MDDKERDKRFKSAQRVALKGRTAIQRDTAGEITRLLYTSLDNITATLAAQPSDYQRWALPPLRQSIQRTLHELTQAASATGDKGMRDAWDAGQALVDEPLSAGGVNLQGIAQSIDTRQLIALREFMTDRISDISLTAMNRINSELGLVMTGIQSPGEAIGAIARVFKQSSRRRALTIVRTELGRAFSVASHERSMQAKEILPGLKKQWRRSGKTHSRPAHDAADGQIRDVDKPFAIGRHQLLHPHDPAAPASETINCGCVVLDYMEHWEMSTPGAKPFTKEELAKSPFKRELQRARGGRARSSLTTPGTRRKAGAKASGHKPRKTLIPSKAGRVVSQYEKQFADSDVEKAVVVSKSGEVLVEKAGGAMQVIFTRSELRKMTGSIVSHNHLDVASFSKDDIALAAMQQVAEMRVVDTKYTYRMKPPKGGWDKKLWQKTIHPAMVDASSRVHKRLRKKVYDGKITEEYYLINLQHEIWQQTAKRTGIVYQRKRREP